MVETPLYCVERDVYFWGCSKEPAKNATCVCVSFHVSQTDLAQDFMAASRSGPTCVLSTSETVTVAFVLVIRNVGHVMPIA